MSSMDKKKKDIIYGDKDALSPNEFDPKTAKIRISMMVDMDVVDAFREKAKQSGKKYQVLMREALRESIFSSFEKEIEERVAKLEAAVLKKRA